MNRRSFFIVIFIILILFPYILKAQLLSNVPYRAANSLFNPISSLPSLRFPYNISPFSPRPSLTGLYAPLSGNVIFNSLIRNYTSPFASYGSFGQYYPYYWPSQTYSPYMPFSSPSTSIPDVAGLSQAEAESILTSAGLMPGIKQEFSETTAKGHVVSQNPLPGVFVPYNTAVVLVISRGRQPAVALELIAEGFSAPVVLTSPDDGSGRLFIADRIGLIKIQSADGSNVSEPFLDIQDKIVPLEESYDERGLLGLAFHPDFSSNGRFFVYYSAPLRDTAPDGWDHTSTISEFTVSHYNPDRANPNSERILLQIDQPQFNHNAGKIVFGPDDYLYIALGDGGSSYDKGLGHSSQGNGQDTSTLLGSILRIDVDSVPYGIPPDNPFIGGEGRDEIFAFGFRNPFGISFDRAGDNSLFVADVGQNLWEEINIVTIGNNYGWPLKEGSYCFDANSPDVSFSACPSIDEQGNPLIDPIIEYRNSRISQGVGRAVIGGFLYRGDLIPELYGKYLFGDWSKSFEKADGSLFIAAPALSEEDTWSMEQLRVAMSSDGRVGEFVLSFGQDRAGELYCLTAENFASTEQTGKVYRILSASGAVPFITVSDQPLYAGQDVFVEAAAYSGPGWIVIYEDNGYGSFGDPIGHAQLSAGTTPAIYVPLDRDIKEEETLYAILHMDANAVGTYEFPGLDIPVRDDNGQLIMKSFMVNSFLQQMVIVPNVISMNQIQAEAEIKRSYLIVGTITRVFSSTMPSGNVINQNPSPGAFARTGSRIDLAVSYGP
ncbi:MAG: PQQ-dependent sugar dehydrogenase [bacterium]